MVVLRTHRDEVFPAEKDYKEINDMSDLRKISLVAA